VLLTGQSTKTQNGAMVVDSVSGSTGVLVRAPWAAGDAQIVPGMLVQVGPEDPNYPNSQWQLITAGPITLGSTDLTFIRSTGVFEVELFGAKGDGSTDDTNAIKAAIAAAKASGRPAVIVFRGGTYKITAQLLFDFSNWEIQGNGSTLTINTAS